MFVSLIKFGMSFPLIILIPYFFVIVIVCLLLSRKSAPKAESDKFSMDEAWCKASQNGVKVEEAVETEANRIKA